MQSSKLIHTSMTKNSFWEAIDILITKPHVVNKRLWGSKLWFKHNCRSNCTSWDSPITCDLLEGYVNTENVKTFASKICSELKLFPSDKDTDDTIIVILIELLPKTYSGQQAYQLACLQKNESKVVFYNITPTTFEQNLCPDFSYSIQFEQNEVVLTAINDGESKSYQWLVNTVLPQFIKWGTQSISSNSRPNICSESLALVSKTKYYEKYNDLKLKYGKEMVKIWPECTDASKFVYEDVAIATYLLLLWEQENKNEKITFVDLGCGNGLLVYILAKEGHYGVGLDVRKRNIWDMYPPNVNLQEKTITPSDTSIFPDADWIIGNHSDELTPWIPVIAAKSSYKSNFFLLPCCAYNFDGSKYQRKNSYNSQYVDYLEYIQQLCNDCGFKVQMDRLKIPSTKRICLVSNGRIYSEQEYGKYCDKIDGIISCGSNVSQDVQNDFKAREAVERVRNCTQIDKNVVNAIINSITNYLLQDCDKNNSIWSKGKTAEINELVKLIPKDQLNLLKSECGGMQTLLKNNHNIFKVQSGTVELRFPKTVTEVTTSSNKRKPNQTNKKIQQRPCWFYSNHPQGCPLKDAECSFLHVKS